MNRELLDPFALDYPESLSCTLDYGHATCLRFSVSGQHIAVGLASGEVVIYDVATYGVARVLTGHSRTIQSLAWSHDNRYLLTAARDWKCILWDLSTFSAVHKVILNAAIWGADLCMQRSMFVASVVEDDAVLVDFTSGECLQHALPTSSDTAISQQTLVSIFDQTGAHVIVGTSKGYVSFISTDTRQIMRTFRLCSSAIKHMRLGPNRKEMVTNSADRVIRVVRFPEEVADDDDEEEEPTIEHRFQDVVNRVQWNACGFSWNGDYIIASTVKQHHIYIWERAVGQLKRTLEGPREELIDVDWHPTRVLLVAAGMDSGKVFVWDTRQPEGWSAFTADFHELEENIEHEEKEDEFDLCDDEDALKVDEDADEERIDITGIDDAPPSASVFTMPVTFDDHPTQL